MEDNVTLIGFMGAGKTTVGQRLAARLSRPFVDVDAVIEARAGMSIPDIFAAEGESGFRRREADAVRRICREGGQVIAAGGGTVMDRGSLSLLRRTGPLVWLRADLEELLSRAAAEAERPRPLLTRPRADLQRLYADRERIYGLADYVVDVSGKSPDEVADQVERLLTGHERPAPQRVPVRLDGRSYDVHVGSGLLDQAGSLCCQGGAFSKGLLITNETVGSLYGGLVQRSLSLAGLRVPRVDIPDGEQYKTLETAQRVYRAAVGHRLDRRSFFIALGGGVVGDLAGFAAATFLRGVALIQVPTTLLAQVDAAVGGKVGVNLDEGKNLVGAFHQPRIVIADVDTLRTLPKRQLAAGLAEVIKYGVIGDPDLLQFVEDRLDRLAAGDRAALLRIVARSCEIKAAVVAEDERETEGVRECLNFGHTIGHALEAAFGYEGMLHGEAVAAGMVAAAMLSARLTGFPEAEVQRLADLLQRAGLPAAPPPVEEAKLLTLMRRDKKTVDQKIRFVLAEQPGRWVVRDDVPDDLVLEIVREQRNRWASAK